ncbi:hypothetical protein ACMSYV_003750 [Proteus mirabilis]
MSIKKIVDKVIVSIYKNTDNYVINQLNSINLGKVELYKPTADSDTILRWDELFKDYMTVGGQNSWELGGVEMEFLRII